MKFSESPQDKEREGRIYPNVPNVLKSPAQPGVRPSSPCSQNTAGTTNTPRNPGDPGHVSRRKEELEKKKGGNTGSIFFQV